MRLPFTPYDDQKFTIAENPESYTLRSLQPHQHPDSPIAGTLDAAIDGDHLLLVPLSVLFGLVKVVVADLDTI